MTCCGGDASRMGDHRGWGGRVRLASVMRCSGVLVSCNVPVEYIPLGTLK